MSAIAEAYCSSSPTIWVRVKSSMMRSAPCPAREGTVSEARPWLRNPLVFRPVSMARSCSIGVVASPTYSSAFAATTSGAFSTAGSRGSRPACREFVGLGLDLRVRVELVAAPSARPLVSTAVPAAGL